MPFPYFPSTVFVRGHVEWVKPPTITGVISASLGLQHGWKGDEAGQAVREGQCTCAAHHTWSPGAGSSEQV